MSVFKHSVESAVRRWERRRPGWVRAGAWILPILLLGGCLHGGGQGGNNAPGDTGLTVPDYRSSLAAGVGGVGRVRAAVSDLDQLFAIFYFTFVFPTELLQTFCFGGSVQVDTQDNDASGGLTAGDQVTLTYDNCGKVIGGKSVQRSGTVQVTVNATPTGEPDAPLNGLQARADVDVTDSAEDGASTRVQGPVDLAFRAVPEVDPTRFIWSVNSPNGTRVDLTMTGADGSTLSAQLESHVEIEWDTLDPEDSNDDRIRYRGTGSDGVLTRLFLQDMEQVIRTQEGSLPEQGLNDAGPTSGELVLEQLQPRIWCVQVGFMGGDPQNPTVEANFDDNCDKNVDKSESFGLTILF